uniref:L1 transposable element RRM domain-containing protein n=2 Tax=Nothobranchius furzeri TaxID=105023 RepID=A0A1A7ZEI3_NOTFU
MQISYHSEEETMALMEANTNLLARTGKVEQMSQVLSKTVKTTKTKLAETEDWNRRNNKVVHGLSERKENANALQYIMTQPPLWFPTLKDAPPEIMRAHRIGSHRSQPTKPRVMIFMCLRYIDRARILKAARGSPLVIEGKEARFTADYSIATRVRQKSCHLVMEKARQAGYQAFLFYLATIKVSEGHEHRFFQDLVKLKQFLESGE